MCYLSSPQICLWRGGGLLLGYTQCGDIRGGTSHLPMHEVLLQPSQRLKTQPRWLKIKIINAIAFTQIMKYSLSNLIIGLCNRMCTLISLQLGWHKIQGHVTLKCIEHKTNALHIYILSKLHVENIYYLFCISIEEDFRSTTFYQVYYLQTNNHPTGQKVGWLTNRGTPIHPFSTTVSSCINNLIITLSLSTLSFT